MAGKRLNSFPIWQQPRLKFKLRRMGVKSRRVSRPNSHLGFYVSCVRKIGVNVRKGHNMVCFLQEPTHQLP